MCACLFLTLSTHVQEGHYNYLCVSVKSHLTSEASVCHKNTVNYSASNEIKIFVGFSLELLCCRDLALPPLVPAENTHAHYSIYHVVALRVLYFSSFIKCFTSILSIIFHSSKAKPH